MARYLPLEIERSEFLCRLRASIKIEPIKSEKVTNLFLLTEPFTILPDIGAQSILRAIFLC